jgi:seryl-tRNA synthetase
MHDIKYIRENPQAFDAGLAKRGLPAHSADILALDEAKRQLITDIQQLQQQRNETARAMGQIKDKSGTEFEQARTAANQIKEKIAAMEAEATTDGALETYLYTLPNLPADDVPLGKDETENKELRKWGTIPTFDFTPKQHFDIGEALGIIDFEQTAKISGSRFVTLKGGLARMERALANFMLDIHTTEFGYAEIVPPYLVRDSAMFGVGQLPKFAEDSFQTTNEYRLIPTAEVSLTNLVADQIVDSDTLPLRYTAYSPCFRSEAGSAGRDTRGMIRQHQFTKVELVSITRPEDSATEHERLTSAAETVLQRLNLPYRVMLLCTGDMGFSSIKTYDLEVWLPGQDCYREISSCSNCGDFQARRMKARSRKKGEKDNQFVHTLNGSALAVGRTMVAIIENYQNADGTVTVPEALRPYMGGMETIGSIL